MTVCEQTPFNRQSWAAPLESSEAVPRTDASTFPIWLRHRRVRPFPGLRMHVMKSKSYLTCIALLAASVGLLMADDPAGDPQALSLEALSPEALRTEVAALKKEDVAWRKIAWKTCLLDGLKASREQNKPVMLWIFIDRPIDDERC